MLRVPGSFNLKDPENPRLVQIVRWAPERRYAIEEFLDYRKPIPTAKSKTSVEFEPCGPPKNLGTLPIHPFFRSVIETGDDPKGTEWRRGAGLDRSVRDYHVVRALLRREIDPSKIRAIFRHYPVGDKYREKGDGYLRRTIQSALRSIEDVREGPMTDTTPEWKAPMPIEAGERMPFPTDALSAWHEAWVLATAETSQTPPDLGAMMSIAAVCTAVARKYRIRTFEEHTEPLNLYLMVVLPPGSRKSSVTAAATAPIEEYEALLARSMADEIAQATNRRNILTERLKNAQRAAARAKREDRAECETNAEEATRARAQCDVPAVPRLLADDVTPEKLGSLLTDQGGRLGVLTAEGGFFEILAGRYSEKGASNLDLVLKSHSGDDVRVDRVMRPPDFIRRPALTLGLAVQPDVMQGLVQKPSFRGRGLLGRFAYSLPENLLGRRNTNPPPMPAGVAENYRKKLRSLLEMSADTDANGEKVEHVLVLSDAARERFLAFGSWLEPQLAPYDQLGHMTDWAGKLQGLVGRLAGLLHLTEHADHPHPKGLPVSLDTMAWAIRLGHYFLAHAQLAFDEMGLDNATDDMRYVLGWIRNHHLEHVSVREIHRSTRRGRFRDHARLVVAITGLQELGYLMEVPAEQAAGGEKGDEQKRAVGGEEPGKVARRGRPKGSEYLVNPIWLHGQQQESPAGGEGDIEGRGGRRR